MPNEKIILNTSEIENEIVNSIKNKDELSILKTMSITFATIKNNLSIDYLKFKEDMYYFIISEVKKIQILLENEKYVSYINNLKVKILDCEEYKAVWHNINTILCELIDFSNIYVDDINHIIIKKCKRYLDENYMHEISLESIAKKYCFNPSYFSNLFKNYLNIGFSEYLLNIRIQNAKEMLKDTDKSMSEISLKIGFKEQSYFNRVFKRAVGISPLRYRKMRK